MRIFYFITEFDIGGAERSLWELARRMKKRGHEVAACAASGRGAVGGWLLADGVEVFHLDARGKGDVRVFLRLWSLLRAWKPDVFHSFLFHANLVGRVAAALARVPVRLSWARVAERRYRSHLMLDRLTIGWVQAEVVVSAGVARFLEREGGIALEKLKVVPNGVDVERFRGVESGRLRRELGVGRETPIVGFVGRLEYQKGPDIALRAFALARRSVEGARLVMVGGGREEKSVRALACELGLGTSVSFLGWREDIPELLSDLDVLVVPSRWEGMANVILEGLAAGVAVVASDVEGTREALGASEYGEVVSSLEGAEFARRVEALLKDPERRQDLGRRGRAHVEANFSLDRVADTCEALYERYLADGSKSLS